MMDMTVAHSRETIAGHVPRHDAFVGVDSDGCVFDTMEIKQKQCFHGLIVSHWGLQAIERPVRDAAEFVNLYSRWRGQNRFVALTVMFDMLPSHPEVKRSGQPLPPLQALRQLVASGANVTESLIRTEAAARGDVDLQRVHDWSLAVNARIAQTVRQIPPFAWARRSLERLQSCADVMCVSQTPTEALLREWSDNGILHLIAGIAGQEIGSKTEHLAMSTGGRYQPGRVLMIGDAQGDRKAAEANHALFYPINPAQEERSWQRFHDEACDRFLAGTYAGPYQDAVVAEFEALLPSQPPWLR